MRALILVDLQNDFVAPGALPVPDGASVVDVANRIMSNFENVIATQDWHPANHQSFASQHTGLKIGDVFELDGLAQIAWPDHCIQGTYGADFLSSLHRDQVDHVVRKGTDATIDSYSGFFDNGHRHETGLRSYLHQHGIQDVFIMGLATDYCVRFTALDAIELGFQTHLILKGCRGVDLHPGDVARAIDEMATRGVHILDDIRQLHV